MQTDNTLLRYADIDPCEICNGLGFGVSLYVQGCPIHCNGCFNPQTWDFAGGRPWTKEVHDELFSLISRPYIRRVSILGGEPLAPHNTDGVELLVHDIVRTFPDRQIWIYSGYPFEEIMRDDSKLRTIFFADVLVDSPFDLSKRDITLAFRGSSNQRILDIQRSVLNNKPILFDPDSSSRHHEIQ